MTHLWHISGGTEVSPERQENEGNPPLFSRTPYDLSVYKGFCFPCIPSPYSSHVTTQKTSANYGMGENDMSFQWRLNFLSS